MGIDQGRVPSRKEDRKSQATPAPARRDKPPYYTAKELAHDVFGIDYDRIYRKGFLDRKYGQGFPRPYQTGPFRWDRATVDRWKQRHMAGAPRQAAANDDTGQASAATIEGQRERIAAAYGGVS